MTGTVEKPRRVSCGSAGWLTLDDHPATQVAVEHHRDHDDPEGEKDAKNHEQDLAIGCPSGRILASAQIGIGVGSVRPVFAHFTSFQGNGAIIAAMRAITSKTAQA